MVSVEGRDRRTDADARQRALNDLAEAERKASAGEYHAVFMKGVLFEATVEDVQASVSRLGPAKVKFLGQPRDGQRNAGLARVEFHTRGAMLACLAAGPSGVLIRHGPLGRPRALTVLKEEPPHFNSRRTLRERVVLCNKLSLGHWDGDDGCTFSSFWSSDSTTGSTTVRVALQPQERRFVITFGLGGHKPQEVSGDVGDLFPEGAALDPGFIARVAAMLAYRKPATRASDLASIGSDLVTRITGAVAVRLDVKLSCVTGHAHLGARDGAGCTLTLRLARPAFVFLASLSQYHTVMATPEQDVTERSVDWHRAGDFTASQAMRSANAIQLDISSFPAPGNQLSELLQTLARLHMRKGGHEATMCSRSLHHTPVQPVQPTWTAEELSTVGFPAAYMLDVIRDHVFGAATHPVRELTAAACNLVRSGGAAGTANSTQVRQWAVTKALQVMSPVAIRVLSGPHGRRDPASAAAVGSGPGEAEGPPAEDLITQLHQAFLAAVGDYNASADGRLAAPAPAGTRSGAVQQDVATATTVNIRRVVITPTRVMCCAAEREESNRAIRIAAEQACLSITAAQNLFIRVSFVDENMSPSFYGTGVDGLQHLYDRIAAVLRDGLTIAGRRFSFLAWSSAMVKEHACWMFAAPADPPGFTAAELRARLGDFRSIKVVAKHAARISQCFSSAVATAAAGPDIYTVVPDVERNGHVFSDGVGSVSLQLAREVWAKYRERTQARRLFKGTQNGSRPAEVNAVDAAPPVLPSAFQIRIGGVKGVVSLDTRLPGRLLRVRPSMVKLTSDHRTVEVCAVPRASPGFLNRQIITLLSTRGVPDQVFLDLQRETLDVLRQAVHDTAAARDLLLIGCGELHGGITNSELYHILASGFNVRTEPFLRSLLQAVDASQVASLRSRSRVFVRDSANLMGVLDETGILAEDEVFFQCCKSTGEGWADGLSRRYGTAAATAKCKQHRQHGIACPAQRGAR